MSADVVLSSRTETKLHICSRLAIDKIIRIIRPNCMTY